METKHISTDPTQIYEAQDLGRQDLFDTESHIHYLLRPPEHKGLLHVDEGDELLLSGRKGIPKRVAVAIILCNDGEDSLLRHLGMGNGPEWSTCRVC